MRIACTIVVLAVCSASACTSLKRFGYEGFGRDDWQHPEQVVQALKIAPGATIADLGAGGGYFTFRLADAAGPVGVVYAVDVDPDMIAYLKERVAEDGYRNVRVVEATPDDPRLPAGEIDLLFTCNTFHHLPEPSAYFARVKQSLAPDGRIAIVEHRGGLFGHATSEEEIQRDMEAAGYRLEAKHDFLPQQGFLVFRPTA